MSGSLLFFRGLKCCELCEQAVARTQLEGLWLCETCAEQFAAAPAPVQMPAQSDDARFGPSLEDIVDRLIRTSGESGG